MLKMKTISILAIAGLVLALAPAAQSDTITIQNLKVDNGEEFISTGVVNLGSSDLELGSETGTEATNQIVGVRFLNVTIPNGATINSASIQFTALGPSAGTSPTLDIYGDKSANAAAFTTTNYDLSDRAGTTATVSWSSIPTWTGGVEYSTPGLKTIIQEIVNQGGWASGNALAIMLEAESTPIGTRRANSVNNTTELTVDYTVPEPATMSLLAIGGIALIRRRRRA
jgi:hypothetical protein